MSSSSVKKRRAQWRGEFRTQTEIRSFGQFVAAKRKAARIKAQAEELARLMVIERETRERAADRERLLAEQRAEEAKGPEVTTYSGDA